MVTEVVPLLRGTSSRSESNGERRKDFVLIDDDESFCHTLTYAARRRGLDLVFYNSLMEMGSIGAFTKYRVAIVDFQLEQMNGVEVAEYFPIFFHDMPVVLISSNDRSEGANPEHKWPKSIKQFVNKANGPDAIIDAALKWRSDTPEVKFLEPVATTVAAEPSHIDSRVIYDLIDLECEGHRFLDRLYDTFISSSEFALADIHTALAALDYTTIKFKAHKLKGSAGNVGATLLAEFCGRLEVHAHHRNLTLIYILVKEIEREWHLVVRSLKNLLLGHNAHWQEWRDLEPVHAVRVQC